MFTAIVRASTPRRILNVEYNTLQVAALRALRASSGAAGKGGAAAAAASAFDCYCCCPFVWVIAYFVWLVQQIIIEPRCWLTSYSRARTNILTAYSAEPTVCACAAAWRVWLATLRASKFNFHSFCVVEGQERTEGVRANRMVWELGCIDRQKYNIRKLYIVYN